MFSPIGLAAGFTRAEIGRLHDAGTAAGSYDKTVRGLAGISDHSVSRKASRRASS